MTSASHKTLLQINDLHFSYPAHQIFSHFSAAIASGITVIRGGDGRGKSTLLRLLAGALTAQGGQLHLNGFDSQAQPANYKMQVFWIEPRSDVFDQLTALAYFALQRERYVTFNDAVLATMTAGLGLQDHLHKQLFMLSTGSKRKVWLAAAFASGAAVTLLDEPFAALDAASIAFITVWLQDAASNNPREYARAWVWADYTAPDGLPLAQVIDLGD